VKPSPGIMLLGRLAAAEAQRSGHDLIEPEHFVEAMTRGESLTDDTMLKLGIAEAPVRRGIAVELQAKCDWGSERLRRRRGKTS